MFSEIILYSNRYKSFKYEAVNRIHVCSNGIDSNNTYPSVRFALLSIFDFCIRYLRVDRNPCGINFLRNPLGRSITFFIGRQDTKHKEAMDSLVKHTVDLLPELAKWAEQPLTLSEEHLFLQARQHIMIGYTEIGNILEGNDGIRNTESQYKALSDAILKQIETSIRNKVSEKLPKFDIENLDLFVRDIESFVEERLFKNKSHLFEARIYFSPNYTIVSGKADGAIFRVQYQLGNKEDLEELAAIMNSIQKDTQLEEKVRAFHALGQQLYDLRMTFKEKVNLLITNIKYGVSDEDRILLGKCDWCQTLKKKRKIG